MIYLFSDGVAATEMESVHRQSGLVQFFSIAFTFLQTKKP